VIFPYFVTQFTLCSVDLLTVIMVPNDKQCSDYTSRLTSLYVVARQRCSLLLVVLFIAVGLFMFTYESTQFNAAGFSLVLFASFVSGLRWTLAQIVLQREETGLS